MVHCVYMQCEDIKYRAVLTYRINKYRDNTLVPIFTCIWTLLVRLLSNIATYEKNEQNTKKQLKLCSNKRDQKL